MLAASRRAQPSQVASSLIYAVSGLMARRGFPGRGDIVMLLRRRCGRRRSFPPLTMYRSSPRRSDNGNRAYVAIRPGRTRATFAGSSSAGCHGRSASGRCSSVTDAGSIYSGQLRSCGGWFHRWATSACLVWADHNTGRTLVRAIPPGLRDAARAVLPLQPERLRGVGVRHRRGRATATLGSSTSAVNSRLQYVRVLGRCRAPLALGRRNLVLSRCSSR